MKRLILTLSVLAVLAGCSSTPKSDQVADSSSRNQQPELIQDQQLVSTFVRNSIRLEWSCKNLIKTCTNGQIVAIEVTGYAPTYGNTEALRETSFGVAHDVALDKLVRFIKQDITSSRVTKTLTRNVEKANDLIKNNSTTSAEVTDADTADVTNSVESDNNNVNSTVRTVVESIRTQSRGIVRGAQIINEQVVDKKTVSTTIRWSVETANQSNSISNYFR